MHILIVLSYFMERYQTKDVFGIQRDVPLNYIERSVDDVFKDALDRRHHVVIFGSSKQGKTCLRKRNLNEEDYIVVHCDNKMDLYSVNINILKKAGFTIQMSDTKTFKGRSKVKVGFGWNLFGSANINAETEEEKSNKQESKPIELDPEDVNDVIDALKSLDFKKYIIIEDFHYLKDETQVDFAVELKAFHENSDLTFIVVGVWLEENRLIALNGDLAGRIKSVNADEWKSSDLDQIIEDGQDLLNILISKAHRSYLIEKSLNNVYILQEVCYQLCKINNIDETQDERFELNCDDLDTIISEVINQHSGRYNSLILNISEGFQATELEMHKWIMYVILITEIEKLDGGLKRSEINTLLQAHHPRKELLNPGNLTQALKSITSLQVRKNTIPIIIDYDGSNLKLNVVDKGFLIWLTNQNRDELVQQLGI